jgi:predicted CopG family antitoxin
LGFKTITVTEEVYKMLKMEKKGDESFSEVIKRLTKERGQLSDSLGAWKMTDSEAEDLFKSLRKHWSHWKYPPASRSEAQTILGLPVRPALIPTNSAECAVEEYFPAGSTFRLGCSQAELSKF